MQFYTKINLPPEQF